MMTELAKLFPRVTFPVYGIYIIMRLINTFDVIIGIA